MLLSWQQVLPTHQGVWVFSKQQVIDQLQEQTTKLAKRSLDQHIKLAVTGLSKSGKTAFITSLVYHLTHQANKQRLPFFSAVQSGRFIACKQVPQSNLSVPTFAYQQAETALLGGSWPVSTNRLNTLRLNIKYRPQSGIRGRLFDTSTLTLDIIDYPGEWLLDLAMLGQTFSEWSSAQHALLLQTPRSKHARCFVDKVNKFDWLADVNESALEDLALEYKALLLTFKDQLHLSELQPGRLLMPAELEGAPIIAFFPLPDSVLAQLDKASENSNLVHLKNRFERYQKEVIKPFYHDFYSDFDRQIILVDLLSALSSGPKVLAEQNKVIKELLTHFDYGKSNLLKRLFKPNIDKVLFAANKVDHLSFEHHKDLTLLLNSLVSSAQNELNYHGAVVETMAIASIAATEQRSINDQGAVLNCIYGKRIQDGKWITYLPAQPPMRLLDEAEWPKQGFEFPSFFPLINEQKQLSHIRLDHVLEFLLGDKLV